MDDKKPGIDLEICASFYLSLYHASKGLKYAMSFASNITPSMIERIKTLARNLIDLKEINIAGNPGKTSIQLANLEKGDESAGN